MEVIVAKSAGACYGVKRAIAFVKRSSEDQDRIYTLGPLIHNPRVVSELERQGVRVVEDVDELSEGDTVVIRSHGVPPSVIDRALDRGLEVEDATCPRVSRAQHAAAELAADGSLVLVVGEPGHPEVEGICACAGGNVAVVPDAASIPDELPDKVGVVVQTTQSEDNLEEILAKLAERGCHYKLRNTICFSTRQRQDAARELASSVPCMIVIGGRNSGNTRRLAEICAMSCPNTHHIEDASELDPRWFTGIDRVGVTSGASTPEPQIEETVRAIKAFG